MIQLLTPTTRAVGTSLLRRRSQQATAAIPTRTFASLPIEDSDGSSHSHSLLILGKPGGGKGTISGKILRDFPQFRHVSTGDELRQHVRNGTELGKEAKKYMDGAFSMCWHIMCPFHTCVCDSPMYWIFDLLKFNSHVPYSSFPLIQLDVSYQITLWSNW